MVAQHDLDPVRRWRLPTPVALLGLDWRAATLFVEPAGAWRADTYIPAYIRAFPFVFVEDVLART